MNLDDLMEVWRTQDVKPVHGVDKTLLLLALRQDEANLRTKRRWEMWFCYGSMALLVVLTVLTISVMIYPNDDDVLTVWDYLAAAVALAAAAALSGVIFEAYQAQARREQGFSESVRDQINRQITVIEHWTAPISAKAWTPVVLALIAAAAFTYISARINETPADQAWRPVLFSLLFAIACSRLYLFLNGRWVRRRLAPRKRRLQALLEELDDR